jgi:hypothetical protein
MVDRSISDADFGRDYLAGKTARTARQVIKDERIPFFRLRGHVYILQSAADAWRESKMTTPAVPTLKLLLREISERVLQQRKGAS